MNLPVSELSSACDDHSHPRFRQISLYPPVSVVLSELKHYCPQNKFGQVLEIFPAKMKQKKNDIRIDLEKMENQQTRNQKWEIF